MSTNLKLIITSLILASMSSVVLAKQAPTRQFAQILPEYSEFQSQKRSGHVIQGITHRTNFKTSTGDDSEATAQAYIQSFLKQKTNSKNRKFNFELVSKRTGLASTTLRFKQTHQGIRVYGGEFTVSINKAGEVAFSTHQVMTVNNLPQLKTKLNKQQAFAAASKYFDDQIKKSNFSTAQAVIYNIGGESKLVYQVDYKYHNQMGHWELLVDATSGEVIRAEDQLHYDTVQANVFDPDPLSSSGRNYGGGYVDGNDRNTSQLTQELKTFPIDVLNQNGRYSLTGQWAESVDVSAPNDGDFSQNSSNFRFNRGQDSFEAVNTYFHISNYLDYLNNTLNLSVKPYQYNTGIRFDAHGDNGNDNSFYSSEGLLVFGEGCVDDAEDADVIIHELGHGIHDWVTLGGLSQVNGLSEGVGDYFAQSYSRSRPGFAWNANDAEYNYVFSWDGHNECWNGRTTNYNRTYPNGLVNQIHTDGQIWSTCLMKVWDQVGREKTDSMVIEGLSMTSSTTNQAQAAQAVLQAATELGYVSDLATVANTFNSCGYDVELVDQLQVSINPSNNQAVVGTPVTFNANVSGGQGGYTYQWDINNDGEIDGTESSITVRYAQNYSGPVTVSVTDTGNTAGADNLDLNVTGPEVALQQVVNIRENLDQVCGNGDDVIDPGERWSTLLDARNVGTQTASGAYLALAKSRTGASSDINDANGNFSDSCARNWIEIDSPDNLVAWQSAGINDYPADDEGSALVQLNDSFDHYGQAVSQVRVSTNGYINTNPNSTGDDWGNDCPLPAAPSRDVAGARIAPMHDDLKDSVLYHQRFSTCPRPSDVGGNSACEVFLWQGADLWDTSDVVESIDVQAILYPSTSQWVFQYSGSGVNGQASTTGIQNVAASDGLTFACNNAGSINTTQAVCVFNKDHQPQSAGAAYVILETPVLSLGALAVNQSQNRTLEFSIAEDAACGVDFSINHEASVYDEGFNAGQNAIFSQTIGRNGQCNVVNNCGVNTSNQIQPNNGIWYNPDRSGNGHDLHFINKQRLTYVTYTGLPDRSPIWYITGAEETGHDQYYNTLFKVSYPGGFESRNQEAEQVGWSNTSVINENLVIQVRHVNGQLSAEKLIPQPIGAPPTINMHTGFWYSASQSGWGESIYTQGDKRGIVTYLYDASGEPYWTNAWGQNDGSALQVGYTDSFCLHCPRVTPQSYLVGSATFSLDDQRTGVIDEYTVNVPASLRPDGASWSRTNLPITNLIPPIED